MINGGWFQKIKGRSAFRAGHTLMFLGMLFCGACAGGQRDTGGEIAQAVKAGGIINIEDTGSLTGKFPTSDVEGKTDGEKVPPDELQPPSATPVPKEAAKEDTGNITQSDVQISERKKRIAELLAPFGEEERKNIGEYIAVNLIGEGGANDLDNLIKWKNMDMPGSFFADGFDKEDRVIARELAEKTGKIPCWIIRRDFDGDGKTEAFVYLFDLKDDSMSMWNDKELWFAAADGTLQLLEEGINFSYTDCAELSGGIYLECRISSDAQDNTRLYQVEGNLVKPAKLDCRYGFDVMEDGRIRVTCCERDGYSLDGNYGELLEDDTAYLTYKHYYYYHDEKGFHEYSGTPVTEEEFCQYDNGEAILRELRKKYMEVKSIYYYADKRMVVNFTEGNIGYEGRPRNNFYLQVPILSEGEEGFVLGWDESFDFWELKEREEIYGYDLFIANGIYRQSYMQELAQYPEFQSPLIFYKEKYKKLAARSLKIGIMKEGNTEGNKAEDVLSSPECAEILVDGSELFCIGGDSLVFRFDKGYDMERLLERAAGADSVGIWIDGEYICGGFFKGEETGSDGDGFLAVGTSGDLPVYEKCLIYQIGALKGADRCEGARARLRAFAEITGLWREETKRIGAVGEYESGEDYRIDLNGDGIEDILTFENGSLWINGKNYTDSLKNAAGIIQDSFILCDIDTEDGIWEIGFWQPEKEPRGCTELYWYDGGHLRFSGSVEGLWSEDGDDVKYCYDGEIRVKSRLNILQVWWTEKTFLLNEEHMVVQNIWEDLYFMEDYKEDQFPYEVLAPIRLYTKWSYNNDFHASDEYIILQPGERFFTVRTDDKSFITIETEHGAYGALYLLDMTKFEKPEGGVYERPEEVIGGLRLE